MHISHYTQVDQADHGSVLSYLHLKFIQFLNTRQLTTTKHSAYAPLIRLERVGVIGAGDSQSLNSNIAPPLDETETCLAEVGEKAFLFCDSRLFVNTLRLTR
jgi:hypothetical protein